MFKKLMMIAGVTVIVAAGAFAVWYFRLLETKTSGLTASGMLEVTEVSLSSEMGGLLLSRPAREGATVRSGEVVAQLDTALLEHQIQSAPDASTRSHLQLQKDRQTLRSPLDGWVIRTPFEAGEHVPPGAPVVKVADLKELTLKAYLPEDRYGQVILGQAGNITVDAYPGRVFPGVVTYIASEAEFTPRYVQTKEDRVKSVYAVKLAMPNPDLLLKPGMFADVQFQQPEKTALEVP